MKPIRVIGNLIMWSPVIVFGGILLYLFIWAMGWKPVCMCILGSFALIGIIIFGGWLAQQ